MRNLQLRACASALWNLHWRHSRHALFAAPRISFGGVNGSVHQNSPFHFAATKIVVLGPSASDMVESDVSLLTFALFSSILRDSQSNAPRVLLT